MEEPSATAPPEGQTPDGRQGQVPDEGDTTSETPDASEGGRTYSESYVKQLRRENAASRTRLSEVEERLQEYEDRDKTEHERLAESLTAAERRAASAEERILRFEIVAERGLPHEAAAFLTGTTREEMELRAEELERLLTEQGRPTTAGFDGGARAPVPDTRSPAEAHNDLLLRSLGREPRR